MHLAKKYKFRLLLNDDFIKIKNTNEYHLLIDLLLLKNAPLFFCGDSISSSKMIYFYGAIFCNIFFRIILWHPSLFMVYSML